MALHHTPQTLFKHGLPPTTSKTWPPRSPDLNSCDFYLCGYLKATVYNPLPKTIDELKANIERDCKKLNSEILKPVFSNLKKRRELILSADGGHIEIN